MTELRFPIDCFWNYVYSCEFLYISLNDEPHLPAQALSLRNFYRQTISERKREHIISRLPECGNFHSLQEIAQLIYWNQHGILYHNNQIQVTLQHSTFKWSVGDFISLKINTCFHPLERTNYILMWKWL